MDENIAFHRRRFLQAIGGAALPVEARAASTGSNSVTQPSTFVSANGHLFHWGDKVDKDWDGVSDFQAMFFQNQPDFLRDGSSGSIYGQRLNTYLGGAANDQLTPACAAVRGYNQIAATVTYCNESGGLFTSDNLSYFGQAVGVFGQANSRHGGRVFGLEAEAFEHPEMFSAASGNLAVGQTSLIIPNGYAANRALVVKNDILLTPTTDYLDCSGTVITLALAAVSTDVFKVYRGDPKFTASGGEVLVYAAGGSDNWNPLSGNRVGLSIFGWRNGTEAIATNIGTLLNLVCSPNDAHLTVDRGINFQGKFKAGIDFTSPNARFDKYLIKMNAAGAGIDDSLNMSLGSFAPTAIAGVTSLTVGNPINGGIFFVTDGSATGRFQANAGGAVVMGSDTDHDVLLNANGSEKWRFLASGALRPSADNAHSLGNGSFRISVVYAGTGAINTSDEELKTEIRDVSAAEKKVAEKVKTLVKAYRFKDAVAEKGNDARIHFGLVAQDVIAAFRSEGLDPWRYGIICADPILSTREVKTTRLVQKCERQIVNMDEIKVINGRAVRVTVAKEVDVPLFKEMNVCDENGKIVMVPVYDGRERIRHSNIVPAGEHPHVGRVYTGEAPLKHREPVIEEEECITNVDYDTGEFRLGIRYAELICFIMAA